MSDVTIESDVLRCTLSPHLGAGLLDLSVHDPEGAWCPLLRRAAPGTTHFNSLACYTMTPWSNRIPRGSFDHAATHHTVPIDWPDGTAIHGVAKDKPWSILDRTPLSARCRFDGRSPRSHGWPWDFESVVRYELDGPSFLAELTITNLSDRAMPAGGGFHPFFVRRLWKETDDVRIRARLGGRYPLERVMPIGPARTDAICAYFAAGRPLGALKLDDVFAGFDGRASIEWPDSGIRAQFDCSDEFGHAVIYSGTEAPAPFFCLEPVSMVNDGFNLASRGVPDTGVRTLAPNESMRMRWRMDVTPIAANHS